MNTITNDKEGSNGQLGGVKFASYKLSLFDKVKIALRERIALATEEKVNQGKPISEWRRAILEDHKETKELERQWEQLYGKAGLAKNHAYGSTVYEESARMLVEDKGAKDYVMRTSAELVKQGKPLSEERKAFLNMMTANNGNELDLESVNKALYEGAKEYLRLGCEPTQYPAILVNTKTGKASYGSGYDKGYNDIILTPFHELKEPRCVTQEFGFSPADGTHNDIEYIKKGAWERLEGVENWVQEFGLSEDKLQDLYKEKVKEHEQEAERE